MAELQQQLQPQGGLVQMKPSDSPRTDLWMMPSMHLAMYDVADRWHGVGQLEAQIIDDTDAGASGTQPDSPSKF